MNEPFIIEPKTYSKIFDKSKMKRRRSSTGGTDSKYFRQDSLNAIIVDNGAYNIKVGMSKDDAPILVPNCVMKAKSERKRLFVGNQIHECRDCSGLYFLMPCERGYITKWEVQKPVWDYIFTKKMYPIDDNPVIVTQPLFNFKSVQDCIDEIFFEEYEVPSMFRLNPTDLVMLKYTDTNKLVTKATSTIIVDSGFSFTHIIPYVNGNKYLRGIKRLNVGGKLLTNHLKDLISYRQYNVMEETYVINQVKEDTCYVAENVIQELKLASNKRNNIVKNYVLPDFNNIRRGYIQDPNDINRKEKEENCQILRLNNERFVVPEILFHPSDIGMKSMGIAEAVVKSIFSCPKEHRQSLAKNIVLVGGNSNFPGFKERMYAELRSELPQEWDVFVYLPKDPITYVWEGGNALLKVPNFKSFLVTKAEYEELGSSIIQQRFNSWMVNNSEKEEEKKQDIEHFSYLDKIKGKSIFGKEDLDASEPDPSIQNRGAGSSSTDKNEFLENSDVKSDVLEGSEESQDYLAPSGENEAVHRQRKYARKSTDGIDDSLEDNSEKLIHTVELFPFGTDSYL